MSYGRYEYYKECIEIAASDLGLKLTTEQVEHFAGAVEGAYENEGMAFPSPERPDTEADLRRQLAREQSKVVCRECDGRGRVITPGPHHSSDSQCWKCHGAGKINP